MSKPDLSNLKADIAAGTYETPTKLDVALERLLDHQRALFSETISPPESAVDPRASGAFFSNEQEPSK